MAPRFINLLFGYFSSMNYLFERPMSNIASFNSYRNSLAALFRHQWLSFNQTFYGNVNQTYATRIQAYGHVPRDPSLVEHHLISQLIMRVGNPCLKIICNFDLHKQAIYSRFDDADRTTEWLVMSIHNIKYRSNLFKLTFGRTLIISSLSIFSGTFKIPSFKFLMLNGYGIVGDSMYRVFDKNKTNIHLYI